MFKKFVAVAALGLVAVLAVPVAAYAADYTSSSNTIVSGANGVELSAVGAGDAVDIDFIGASFQAGETVSATVDGFGTPTLSTVKATPYSLTKVADGNGSTSFRMNIPADAQGSYSVTATGLITGNSGTATVTVIPADAGVGTGTNSSDGLASTGANVSMLLIWRVVGVLILGAAMIAVRVAVRRQRASV